MFDSRVSGRSYVHGTVTYTPCAVSVWVVRKRNFEVENDREVLGTIERSQVRKNDIAVHVQGESFLSSHAIVDIRASYVRSVGSGNDFVAIAFKVDMSTKVRGELTVRSATELTKAF